MKKSREQGMIYNDKESGFTLIELLVVILIIGILSAIAIPAFLNQRKSAVDASAESDIKNAALQIETQIAKIPHAWAVSVIQVNDEATFTVSTPAPVINKYVKVKMSEGNVISVIGNSPLESTKGYVLKVTNPGGDKAATSTGFEYRSNGGGLQN